MHVFRYIITVVIFFFSFSSIAQEVKELRLGTFQIQKSKFPELMSDWKSMNFKTFNSPLKLRSVTTDNYRTQVDMSEVVAGIARSKQSSKNQKLIDNIRLPYAHYSKTEDRKGNLRIENSIHMEVMPNSLFNICPHGNNRRYCRMCSPHMGNFGFGIYPYHYSTPGNRNYLY